MEKGHRPNIVSGQRARNTGWLEKSLKKSQELQMLSSVTLRIVISVSNVKSVFAIVKMVKKIKKFDAKIV